LRFMIASASHNGLLPTLEPRSADTADRNKYATSSSFFCLEKIPTRCICFLLEFQRPAWLPCKKSLHKILCKVPHGAATRNAVSAQNFPHDLVPRSRSQDWERASTASSTKHCEFQRKLRISEDESRTRIFLRAVDWIPPWFH